MVYYTLFLYFKNAMVGNHKTFASSQKSVAKLCLLPVYVFQKFKRAPNYGSQLGSSRFHDYDFGVSRLGDFMIGLGFCNFTIWVSEFHDFGVSRF